MLYTTSYAEILRKNDKHMIKFSLLRYLKLPVARRGLPLAIWGVRVTVLLKNIVGVTFVNKPRANCLFEANFNHWTKLIFARRMIKKGS